MLAQFGTALGVAGANLLLQWRTAEHYSVLNRRFVNGDAEMGRQLEQLANWFSAGQGPQEAAQLALGQLAQTLNQQAALLGQALNLQPYDALVDEFSPGITTQDIDKVFKALSQRLPSLINEVIQLQSAKPPLPLASDAKRSNYLSCSCSSERMRLAVCEASALPSLLRTFTWLAVPACVTCTWYCSALSLAPESDEKMRASQPRSSFAFAGSA